MKKSVMLALAALTTAVCFAEELSTDERVWPFSPLGLSLAAPVQVPFVESDVYGLRFGGFFGWNAAMYGVDFGLVERSTTFAGAQAAAFGWTGGNAFGLQAGALANVVGGNAKSLQAGFANVTWGDFTGLQLGAIDYNGSFAGLQFAALANWNELASYGFQLATVNADQVKFDGFAVGALNYAYELVGAQIGCFNLCEKATGVQIGVINACDELHGIQIGALNMIATSPLSVMVVANASF